MQGSGVVSANGGAAHGSGGGGSGGRIAVRWKARKWSFINFKAFGGQGAKRGGAGTMYFEVNGKLVCLVCSSFPNFIGEASSTLIGLGCEVSRLT